MTSSTRLALKPEYQGRTEAVDFKWKYWCQTNFSSAFQQFAFTDEFLTLNRKHDASSSLVWTYITFHHQQYGRSEWWCYQSGTIIFHPWCQWPIVIIISKLWHFTWPKNNKCKSFTSNSHLQNTLQKAKIEENIFIYSRLTG